MLNTLILVKKKLENEIMFLKSDIMEKQEILRKIKRVIDNNCKHNWITDYFDVDVEPADLKLGGCATVITSETGGEVASEDGGVDIPPGALSGSETISVGDIMEELPEEANNTTGFEVEQILAFTPYDLVFSIPVEITVLLGTLARSISDEETLCSLENSQDKTWKVVLGATCSTTSGGCTAEISEFGIFAVCTPKPDCNYVVGGSAYKDVCGECVGGNTGRDAEYTRDDCGLCDGMGILNWWVDADNDDMGYGVPAGFCVDGVPEYPAYVPNHDDKEPYCSTNDSDACGLCEGSCNSFL